ncbi:MAG TPA: hypothetical protein VMV91_04300 [Rhodocyclaceae bacterium]|nr:hypothetical protein [Rhodocyclaceae bacterium]
MSVSNVSLDSGVTQSAWQPSRHRALQDFDQLFQAMQSGSLSGAQQAYAALQQLQPAVAAASSGSAAATGSVATVAATDGNPVSSDWSSLGIALQSGSLSSAQGAFAKLQQDLEAATNPALNQAQAVYAAMQGTFAQSASAESPVGTDLSALQQALQSGNTTSAQDLLAKLEQDLQAAGQALPHRHHHHGTSAQAATSAYASSQPAAAVGNIASRGVA